jgi:hypothetical protein
MTDSPLAAQVRTALEAALQRCGNLDHDLSRRARAMSGGGSRGIPMSPHHISSVTTETDPGLRILAKAVPRHRSGTRCRGRKSALNWEVPHVHSLPSCTLWRRIGRGGRRRVNRTALSGAGACVLWLRFCFPGLLLSAAAVLSAAVLSAGRLRTTSAGDLRTTPRVLRARHDWRQMHCRALCVPYATADPSRQRLLLPEQQRRPGLGPGQLATPGVADEPAARRGCDELAMAVGDSVSLQDQMLS